MNKLLALLAIASVFLLGASAAAVTLVVTPSEIHVGDSVEFAGCGYGAGKDILLIVEPPEGYDWGFQTRMDADGCFDTATNDIIPPFVPTVAGEHEAYVYPSTGSGVGTYGHHKALVEYDFEVLG
jgi:hypothetical protein